MMFGSSTIESLAVGLRGCVQGPRFYFAARLVRLVVGSLEPRARMLACAGFFTINLL
jgi:hypothetical protein